MHNVLHRFLIVLLLPILFLLPGTTEAAAVLRSGDTVSVAGDQTIEGNFYAAGSAVNLSGTAEHDVAIAGGRATINGTVVGDALILAGSADLHGAVGDDVRVVAGEVTIAEPVAGDVLVVAGDVHILSTASIGGDLLLYAGNAVVEGAVTGNVLGSSGAVRIDGPVGGNIDIIVDQLTLGDRAAITGGVSYTSYNQLVQALNASVGGEVTHNSKLTPAKDASFFEAVIPALVIVFATLIWFLLSKRTLTTATTYATTHHLRSFLFGLLFVFGVPFAVTVLLVTFIGILAGLVGLASYLLFLFLAAAVIPAALGQWLLSFWKKEAGLTLPAVALGGMVTALCLLIPFIGIMLLFIVHILAAGALCNIVLQRVTRG